MAVIVPFTLATQIVLSPQGNSRASFLGGSSPWEAILTNGMVALARELRTCYRGQQLFRLQGLRDHHLAREARDHVFLQANFGRLLRQRHRVDLVLQLKQRVEKVLR